MGVSKGAGWECLSEAEMERFEAHCARHLGPFEMVIHEVISEVVHIDLLPFAPTEARPNWVFVTMGMSALKMKTPRRFGLFSATPEYGELMMVAPADWIGDLDDFQKGEQGERLFRPFGALKSIARYVHQCETYFTHGHTIAWADDTMDAGAARFPAAILHRPVRFPKGLAASRRVDGANTHLLSITPIIQAELDFKLSHNSEALFAKFAAAEFPVEGFSPHRACSLTGRRGEIEG
jgi:hypothetical protein